MEPMDNEPAEESSGSFKKFLSTFSKTPISVRLFCCFVILTSVLGYFWGDFLDFLSLIPARTLFQGRIWSIVTFCLIENSALCLFIDVPFFIFLSYWVFESSDWNFKKFVWASFLMCVSLGVSTVVSTYLLYVVFFHFFAIHPTFFSIFYDVRYTGFSALVTMLTICVKKNLPDLVILPGSVRGKHLCLIYLLIAFFISAITLDASSSFLVLKAVVWAWLYLRFYERHDDNSRGYSEESFSFKTFFPDSWQNFIEQYVSAVFYECAKAVRLIKVINVSQIGTTDSTLEEIVIEKTPVLEHVEEEIDKRIEEKILLQKKSQEELSNIVTTPTKNDKERKVVPNTPNTPVREDN